MKNYKKLIIISIVFLTFGIAYAGYKGIDSTPIGANVPSTGAFTTLSSTSATTLTGTQSTGPAAVTTGFAGTVSSSSTTVTFSSAADWTNYAKLGAVIIANAQTRTIVRVGTSPTVYVDTAPSPAWSTTAITSIQAPVSVEKDSSGIPVSATSATGMKILYKSAPAATDIIFTYGIDAQLAQWRIYGNADTKTNGDLTLYDQLNHTLNDFWISSESAVNGTTGIYAGTYNDSAGGVFVLRAKGCTSPNMIVSAGTENGDRNANSTASTITGRGAYASAVTNLDGGAIQVTGGAGASGSAGDADGGAIYLDGGANYGTGDAGDVIVGNTRGNLVVKTNFYVQDETTAAYKLEIASNSDGTVYTADKKLTIDTNNGSWTLDIPASQSFPAVAGTVEASHLVSADASGNITGIGGALSGFDIDIDDITLLEDGGVITLITQSVTATPAAGTEQGWESTIDGELLFKVSAEADHAGSIQNPRVTLNCPLKVPVTTVNTASYDVTDTDYILHVTYTATGACAIDLKTAQLMAGRTWIIKDAGGNAATYNITVTTQGAETIDGAATAVLNGDYDSISIYCDGSNYFIF